MCTYILHLRGRSYPIQRRGKHKRPRGSIIIIRFSRGLTPFLLCLCLLLKYGICEEGERQRERMEEKNCTGTWKGPFPAALWHGSPTFATTAQEDAAPLFPLGVPFLPSFVLDERKSRKFCLSPRESNSISALPPPFTPPSFPPFLSAFFARKQLFTAKCRSKGGAGGD